MKLKNTVYAAVALTGLGFATAAQAEWFNISPTNSPISIQYTNGKNTETASVSYDPSPAVQIWYSNDPNGDLGNQSPATVESVVEEKFEKLVDFVSACDNPTSGCTAGASGDDDLVGWDNAFHSNIGFNYLAIHFGKGELLFHWDDLINDFKVAGLPYGLSNYRAYTDNPSQVPVPAAVWLLGSALLGFVGYRRRA